MLKVEVKEDYYKGYLQSAHWRKLRKQKLEQAGHRCEKCGATKGLTVHHIRYRAYAEQLGDLQVLCWHCHKQEHAGEHKSEDDLLDIPEEFI